MNRLLSFFAALCLATCSSLTPAPAATTLATPATAAMLMATVPANDTVKLGPGAYGSIYLRGATARLKPVTIDASDPGATLAGFRCDGCSGVTVTGVTTTGGLSFQGGSNLTIVQVLCTGAVRACVELGNVTDATVEYVESIDAGSDGVDVAASQRVDVGFVTCTGSKPTPGAHPDCVQIYTKAGAATSYVTLHDSTAVGDTQGFDMFGNNVLADHVVFRGLTVQTRYPRGISMTSNGGCSPGCSLGVAFVRPMRGSKYIVQLDAGPGVATSDVSGNSVRP